MSGHIYVLGYRYCLFSVIFFEILELFRQRGIFSFFILLLLK